MLDALIDDAIRRHGGEAALIGDERVLAYATLHALAEALADALRRAGAGAAAPVAVRVANDPLDFVALLATWRAGAVAVPIHRQAPPGAVAAMLRVARCTHQVDLRDPEAPEAAVSALAPDPAWPPAPARDAALRCGGALVIFTSGSTGEPKGVVLSHAAFAGKLQANQRRLRFEAGDRTLLLLANTFSFGLWVGLLALMTGGRLHVAPRFDPDDVVSRLADGGITRTAVVPTMVRAWFARRDAADLARDEARLRTRGALRDVVIGGEPLGDALGARLRAFLAPARLWDVYGLTETATSDFVLPPDAPAAWQGTIGRPAEGVRHRIVDPGDPDRGPPAPGVPGELQIDTPFRMAGYLGDPALTEAAFDGPWLRTGDLAVDGPDGTVAIRGRLKELISRGAIKVAPMEIERALSDAEGVAAALVAGVPDPVLGERIHVLLVPRPGARLSAEALRAHLADRLERFKHPDRAWLGESLPVGRTGKIDRAAWRALALAGQATPLPGWSTDPRGPEPGSRDSRSPT